MRFIGGLTHLYIKRKFRSTVNHLASPRCWRSLEVTLPGSPSALAWEFASCVTAPLKTLVLKALPRCRSRRSPSSASLHYSSRLAAKCHSRAANATLRAQKVLSSKWDPATLKQQSDLQAWSAFQQAFQEPLDSSKRQTLQPLFKVDLTNVEGMLEDAC
jgi:hypothetical protein